MTLERISRFLPVVVAALTLAAFLPALDNGWVNWDDPANFLQNPNYRGLALAQVRWMWSASPEASWSDHFIPLSWMTLGLDYKFWQMNPFGYHLTSVILHVANAVLVYFVALSLLRIGRPAGEVITHRFGAALAALLFGVHPLRVESVAWITERRDVLCGLFYLLAVLAYLRANRSRPPRRRWFWISVGCFGLALLSKEIAITLPAILLILDVYPLDRLPSSPRKWTEPAARRVWLEKIPFAILGIALLGIALRIRQGKDHFDAMAGLGWYPRIAAPIYNLAFYLAKTLLPIRLSPFYPFTQGKIDPLGVPFLASAVALVAIAAAAIALRRKFPAVAAAALAYAITISPVLGFIPSGPRLANDRNTYLACIGWAILAGAAAVLVWTRRRTWLIPACAATVVTILAMGTYKQIAIWHDSEALWTRALDLEPSFIAYTNMGEVLAERGDDLWAIEHFQKAIAMRPDFAPSHVGLGGCLLRLGRGAEAAREFEMVISMGKDLAIAQNGLACALALQGRLDEAVDHFGKALQLRPDYPDARRNLAQVVARMRATQH